MTTTDTPRLHLRPWDDKDAPALYELARDPRIGMLCADGSRTSASTMPTRRCRPSWRHRTATR